MPRNKIEWTEKRRAEQAKKMKERHELRRRVKIARIERDARIAAKQNLPESEQVDLILRMMNGNEGSREPILRGNGK